MDFKAYADLGATLIRWDAHTFLIDTLLHQPKQPSSAPLPHPHAHPHAHAHPRRPASASNLHHSTTTLNDLTNPNDNDLLSPLQSDLNHVTTVLLSNFMSAARLILSLARNNLHLAPYSRVLATRPTLDLMRHCLEESIHSRMSDTSVASANTGAANVQAVYRLLESVSERATVVTFGESLLLSPGFELACASSAFTIGSANFAITHGSQKLVILGETSACTSRFPEPMDIDPLGFADILFVSALSTSPARNWDDSLRELDKLILHHAHLRRPLIFPLSVTSPVFFDVLHALCRTLDVHPALLESTQVVILSPVMDAVTEYVNVSSEHLHPFQRGRTQEGRLPMLPSALSDPKYAARFRTYSGLGDPEVEESVMAGAGGTRGDHDVKAVFVLAGHEGFTRGDAVEVAKRLGRGGAKGPVTVCITDPRAADKWVQRHAEPLPGVDVIIHRLDPRINAVELGHFLMAIRPHSMVLGPVPETYAGVVESIGIPCRQLLVVKAGDADTESESEEYGWVHVALPPSLHLAHMSNELAAYIASEPAITLPDGRSVRNAKAIWDLDTNELVRITTAADQAAAVANAPDPRFVCMQPRVDMRALGEQLGLKIKYPIEVASDEAVEVPEVGCRVVWDAGEGGVEVLFEEGVVFGEGQVGVMEAVGEVVAAMCPQKLGV